MTKQLVVVVGESNTGSKDVEEVRVRSKWKMDVEIARNNLVKKRERQVFKSLIINISLFPVQLSGSLNRGS